MLAVFVRVVMAVVVIVVAAARSTGGSADGELGRGGLSVRIELVALR